MGKLKDIKHIYETYQQDIVNELNINVPTGGPTITSGISDTETPHPAVKSEDEESCSLCMSSPCSCSNIQDDSNVEMAKSEVFKILKNANQLMNILQKSESIEPWQLSKIVKASDYICSVNSSVEYDEFEKCQKEMEKGINDIKNGMVVVSQIRDMLSGEDIEVNEAVLKNVIFNIECLKIK